MILVIIYVFVLFKGVNHHNYNILKHKDKYLLL